MFVLCLKFYKYFWDSFSFFPHPVLWSQIQNNLVKDLSAEFADEIELICRLNQEENFFLFFWCWKKFLFIDEK